MRSSRHCPLARAAHANRPGQYTHLFHHFGQDELRYPVSIDDIPAIEERLGVTINVFSFFTDEGKARHPLYVSEKSQEKVIDLPFWDDEYAWIKNFRRFNADLSHNHTIHCCRRCLGHFKNADFLSTHHSTAGVSTRLVTCFSNRTQLEK